MSTMTAQDVVDACWTFATTEEKDKATRDEIAERIAAHFGADPEKVAAVLRLHRGRVDGIYLEANGRPSLGTLELQDEAVANDLAALPTVEVVE